MRVTVAGELVGVLHIALPDLQASVGVAIVSDGSIVAAGFDRDDRED